MFTFTNYYFNNFLLFVIVVLIFVFVFVKLKLKLVFILSFNYCNLSNACFIAIVSIIFEAIYCSLKQNTNLNINFNSLIFNKK